MKLFHVDFGVDVTNRCPTRTLVPSLHTLVPFVPSIPSLISVGSAPHHDSLGEIWLNLDRVSIMSFKRANITRLLTYWPK
jgi:hypothetical protein